MRKSRRQVLIRFIARASLALVALDVLFFFAVFRPIESVVASEQQRFSVIRHRILQEQARVERLAAFQEAMPDAGEKITAFKRDHVPPRRRAFSQAARLLQRMSEQSGIQLSGVHLHLASTHDDPLERLGLEINVEGPFTGLLKFAHGLETASDFIVIRQFSFEPGKTGALALRLAADLYLTP